MWCEARAGAGVSFIFTSEQGAPSLSMSPLPLDVLHVAPVSWIAVLQPKNLSRDMRRHVPPHDAGVLREQQRTGGILSVKEGTTFAKIALLGNYMAASFVAAADRHGGTLITGEAAQTANQLVVPPPTMGRQASIRPVELTCSLSFALP